MSNAALVRSETHFKNLLEEAPIATCLLVGRELRIEIANDPMFAIWGKGKSILGMPLAEAMPELQGQPFLSILDDVFTTGQTYSATGARADLIVNGVLGTYYFDFTYKPLRNADGEVYAIMDMAVDVTDQVLAHQRLVESEARFRNVVQKALSPICLLKGADMVLEIGNQPLLDVWNVGLEAIGKPLLDILPEMKEQPIVGWLSEVFQQGVTHRLNEIPAYFIRKDGVREDYYFNFVYQPWREVDGRISGVLAMATDITEQVIARQKIQESEARQRQLNEELETRVEARTQELLTANQDLQRSNDNLQRFAYVASHDLQEPLRKIQSFSSLIQERYSHQLDEEGLHFLSRMSAAGARMSILIKDLLSYSRIATRQQAFGSVSLNAIIATALNTLELEIEQKQAQIEVDDLPIIRGDESQLGQLFHNLLSNALKFTQAQSIPRIKVFYHYCSRAELPAQVTISGDGEQFCQISVNDQGIGFDQKYLDLIFQVFQRLHDRNNFPGTGVGLAICQRVVENHGGGITAVSEPGQGATFQVYLPV